MRLYESVYIVAATIADDDLPQLTDKVEGIITQEGGLVVKHTPWGKNKLAYNIRTHGYRHDKGHYFRIEYLSAPTTVVELERNLRIDERFLRYLTVKLEDRPDGDALKARAEEEKAKQSPAPAPEEPPADEPSPEVEASEEEPAVEEEAPVEEQAAEVDAPEEEAPGEAEPVSGEDEEPEKEE